MIEIKKYANRRLYNLNESAYITLAECADIIRSGEDVQITDAKTGQDLTAVVLIQVIMEYEQAQHRMLPVDALKQIIRAYDSPTSHLLSRYLARTMSSFTRHHSQLDKAVEASLDAMHNGAALNDDGHKQPSADNTALSELKSEIDRLHDRLKALEN